MAGYSDYSKVLDTYSLEEILDFNEISAEEALAFMVDEEFISLPNPEPVDLR